MLRENPGFFQASLSDPWQATHETILYMCGLVRDSASDPVIAEAARDACKRFAGLSNPSTPGGKSECCWWWVKHAVKFVHHEKLLRAWLGKADELQLLISPDVLLHMQEPKGDCAVFTCLVCAMLDSLGVPWEIVTVAVDPSQPDIFSHVYPRAVLESGMRLVLDASHGNYPGWEVPKRRQYTKQVWNSDGEPINDQDSGYRGLHGMNFGLSGCPLNGLGQDDGSGDYVETNVTETTTTTDGGGGGSSTPTAAELALLNSGMSLVGKVVAPTVTYTGSGGTSLTAPASSSAATSLLSSLGTSLGGTSSSMLVLGALAVGALLLVSMIGKK
jgi:hypothetical protein